MEGMGISCTESVGSYLDEGSGADADSDTNDAHTRWTMRGQDTRMCESWSKGALTSPNSLSRR